MMALSRGVSGQLVEGLALAAVADELEVIRLTFGMLSDFLFRVFRTICG